MTNISLPPTAYTAKAKLVETAGNPRTTTIDVNPFTIVEGTTLRVPVELVARAGPSSEAVSRTPQRRR